MFKKFGLDYVLLEAYEEIVAPTGAAIGLMPNGSFIMDQLGCYEAIELAAQDGELEDSHIRDSNSKSLMGLKHIMYHEEKRHGYPMLFSNRQWFLKVLYDQLKNKDCIQLKSRVDHIKSIEGGIQVTTNDGKSYEGDFVLGADGIHSNVRQEMRRIADVTNPKYFEPGEEDTVPCYYQYSYGIAQHVDSWPGREQCFTAGRGKSFVVVSGPGDRCYWFLFIKLPVVKHGTEIPKYSKEDEARFVEEHASLKIKENLNFGQVYAKRLTSTLTPLHEIVYKKWVFNRIFLVGDSAHKVNSRFNQSLAFKVLMPLAGPHNFFRDLSLRIVGGSRLKHIDLPSRPRAIPYDHELPAKPLGVLPSRIAWGLFSLGMILLPSCIRICQQECGSSTP
ncbi:hypothetical protein G7Y89_g11898 [Cudoniella acicularis]|uniref:FAD-binding domain-containing protein n=1 Tax=Cudoniella acicularis TaxID=354080 RepID=A0A8H4RCE7_9HELO|nr:hypothetical protein G7Y89_g11898 [Cudoniella acicularis]